MKTLGIVGCLTHSIGRRGIKMVSFVTSVIIDTTGYLLMGYIIDCYRGRYTDPEKYTMKYLSGMAQRHPEWENK